MTIRGDGPTRLPADPTYRSYHAMKSRCLNPNHSRYSDYGGRGIKICERWLDFENFLEDMGHRPDGCSIGRNNNDKDYSLDNCRWETNKDQARNKSTTLWVEIHGETISLAEAVEEFSVVSYATAMKRYYNGWDIEDVLLKPVR